MLLVAHQAFSQSYVGSTQTTLQMMAVPLNLPDVILRDGACGDIGAINRCQTTTASLRDEELADAMLLKETIA
jgi:hypothetical protein